MPRLDEFIDALAEHVAHERGWSITDATRWVTVPVSPRRMRSTDNWARRWEKPTTALSPG